MHGYSYVWDEKKNKSNIKKHGVSFIEAETVFDDVNALVYDDEEHSNLEERFIIIGMSSRLRLLMVCHCFRENDTQIRIISARKATKNEQKLYRGMS